MSRKWCHLACQSLDLREAANEGRRDMLDLCPYFYCTYARKLNCQLDPAWIEGDEWFWGLTDFGLVGAEALFVRWRVPRAEARCYSAHPSRAGMGQQRCEPCWHRGLTHGVFCGMQNCDCSRAVSCELFSLERPGMCALAISFPRGGRWNR
jgi:hypothetical protein